MKTVSVIRIAAAMGALICTSPTGLNAQALETRAQAPLLVFTSGATASAPAVKTVLGTVSGSLCRRPWDAAATDADALAPIEAKARAMGAAGLIDVTFDHRRTDLKAPCWQRVEVRATAVVFGATEMSAAR